jgi:hypothetical protein
MSDYRLITWNDILTHKQLSEDQLTWDLNRLRNYTAVTNRGNTFGNPFIYHYQLANMLDCKRHNKKHLQDLFHDPVEYERLIQSTIKKNRKNRIPANDIFECYRMNTGSISVFKASTAKYIYKKYSAGRVLDPTAGWGGRMLAAHVLGIEYTGFDTNTNLKPAYDSMLSRLNDSRLAMRWEDCLQADWSGIDFDFVLTSPPYVNLELYPHMTPWTSKTAFYQDFFIPLFEKCLSHIQPGGIICFNITPQMYQQAQILGLPPAALVEARPQPLGQKSNTAKQDQIYIWKKEIT